MFKCQKFRHFISFILSCIFLLSLSSCDELINEKENKAPQKTKRYIENHFLCKEGTRQHQELVTVKNQLQTIHPLGLRTFENWLNAEASDLNFSTEVNHKIIELLEGMLSRRSFDSALYLGVNDFVEHLRGLEEVLTLIDSHSMALRYDLNDRQDIFAMWERAHFSLLGKIERFLSQSCQINRMYSQLQGVDGTKIFLTSASKVCPSFLWDSGHVINEGVRREIRECVENFEYGDLVGSLLVTETDFLVDLCKKSYLISSNEALMRRCRHEIRWLTLSGESFQDILESILMRGLNHLFDRYYKLNPSLSRASASAIQCENIEDGVYQLIIPLEIDSPARSMINSKGFSVEEFMRRVEAFWESDNIKIRLVPEDKASLVLEFENSSQSYFQSFDFRTSRARVVLSSYLSGPQLFRTAAHELGHALGFPDCYLEAYDLDLNRIMYFELGSKAPDLMCSLGPSAKAREHAFIQLKQQYCK